MYILHYILLSQKKNLRTYWISTKMREDELTICNVNSTKNFFIIPWLFFANSLLPRFLS